MKQIQWSYSGLKDYVNCPRQYHEVKVLKRFTKKPTQQMLYGTEVHTALENYVPLIGPERASRAHAYRLFDAAGAVQCFGSDYPAFPLDPLLGLYTAVTRQTVQGLPAGGWYPEHRLSVEAALAHYTRDAAFASFNERDKGTIAPGRLADFVVLSADILAIEPARLLETRVLLTVMGGRETYRAAAGEFADAGARPVPPASRDE